MIICFFFRCLCVQGEVKVFKQIIFGRCCFLEKPLQYSLQPHSTDVDTQRQMCMVSSNPAYGPVAEHSRQPVPQDDHTYSTVDSSQHETVATSGNSAYGTSFIAVASAK